MAPTGSISPVLKQLTRPLTEELDKKPATQQVMKQISLTAPEILILMVIGRWDHSASRKLGQQLPIGMLTCCRDCQELAIVFLKNFLEDIVCKYKNVPGHSTEFDPFTEDFLKKIEKYSHKNKAKWAMESCFRLYQKLQVALL